MIRFNYLHWEVFVPLDFKTNNLEFCPQSAFISRHLPFKVETKVTFLSTVLLIKDLLVPKELACLGVRRDF
jgi:hypothetical protein